MTERISISIFRFLFTILSLAIIVPCMWGSDYAVLTLSFTVFSFSKIVDSVDGILQRRNVFFLLYVIECFISIIAVSFCFFYLSVFVNDIAVFDMSKSFAFCLFITDVYPRILVCITTIYFITDAFDLVRIIYDFYHTKCMVHKMIENSCLRGDK